MTSFDSLIQTVAKLRSPSSGCPWDLAQTHQSLRRYLVEECAELLEALDKLNFSQNPEVVSHFQEELGDVLLQIMLHSKIAEENNHFNIQGVAETLNTKLQTRHPHVFGSANLKTPEEVHENWEKQKNLTKNETSILKDLPKELPALLSATKIIEKVSKVGFQWENIDGPLEKLNEELLEFQESVKKLKTNPNSLADVQHELGDLLFSLCNIAHFLKINPEDSLREMLMRFKTRFQYIEKSVQSQNKKMEDCTLEELDKYWNEAKKLEKK